MRAILRNFAGALAAVLTLAGSAHAQPTLERHVEVDLVAQEAGVVPGGTTYVAVRQKIDVCVICLPPDGFNGLRVRHFLRELAQPK